MIEYIDDARFDEFFDRIEIHDHPGCRAVRLQGSAHRDFEAIRMSVHAGAFPGVMRQDMSGLEAEVLANLHIV